ncbi:hypothetical protein K3G39_20255 [Pontibacter sp. HSC-14F20]|uniref:hypothetical protein n=1 Tax=Pontibacter sp. HSC-14F20 TaxID=2864136 RepID=UPI001C7300B8|nr:hypothetical protein [Pontibacter sp. HSC-14F20]MBX0335571.1 hypothetical protein [Pontibacter sp. HSC-14F20]
MIGENENLKKWEENLFNAIRDVSDLELQKSAWLGNNPKFISSFSEIISILYDDFDLERYLILYKSRRGVDRLYNQLETMKEMINDYKKQAYKIELEPRGQELILSDPRWLQITDKAKEVCRLLPPAGLGL